MHSDDDDDCGVDSDEDEIKNILWVMRLSKFINNDI